MCSRIVMHTHVPPHPDHPIAKVKPLKRGLGLGFDLLTSGLVHAKVLPWTICLPTLVLITQAFLLYSADKQTDRQDWTPYPRRRLYIKRG